MAATSLTVKRAFGIAVASLWDQVEVSDCGCWLLAQRSGRCGAAVGCVVTAEPCALAFPALRVVCGLRVDLRLIASVLQDASTALTFVL